MYILISTEQTTKSYKNVSKAVDFDNILCYLKIDISKIDKTILIKNLQEMSHIGFGEYHLLSIHDHVADIPAKLLLKSHEKLKESFRLK